MRSQIGQGQKWKREREKNTIERGQRNWPKQSKHSTVLTVLTVLTYSFCTYYGKQESRTSKEEIEKEMTLLTEEIEETKNNGEILLAMDANAKIGLLGENDSRKGKLIKKSVWWNRTVYYEQRHEMRR